jgi:uncharacterized protein (TIGR02271 family)
MDSRSNENVNLDQDDSINSEIETENTTITNNDDDDSLSNTKENEEVIPLISEELDVIKTELVDEAIITKEPIKETQTEQIPIMHEELVIEQRPVIIDNLQSLPSNNNNNISTGYENEEFKPVETNSQITIPLKREEVEVTIKPYVIEELIIKKKAVTKTQTVSEEILTERAIEPQF